VKYDLLILYSGGADSTLLLERALADGLKPYCVLVDYDQNQKIELDFAKRYLNEKCVPSQIVKIHGLGIRSALTTGEKSIYDDVSEMYVPSRNLMFLSVAASVAENLGIDEIWYGANASDDENDFPDCKPEWVSRVNDLLEVNASTQITFRAPLINTFKEDILKEMEERGIDMEKVYSGYLEDNKDRMVISLDFLGGKKLPELKAEDIVGKENENE
jgi:7-cyano-7-deazaguanine synthase